MEIFYLYLDKFNGQTKRIKEYNAGRYIVEYAAKNFFNIKNLEIEIINDKPKYKYSDIQFSISHSHNIAAVCFDKHPVGFDIEFIKQRDFIPIAKRMNFVLKENTLNEFYREWTKFEAEYKLQQKSKNFFSSLFQEKYIMTVASGNDDKISVNFHLLPIV